MLATGGGGDHTVRLWDLSAGRPFRDPLDRHTGQVLWGAWRRVGDRHMLATGCDHGGGVFVWDPSAGAEVGGSLSAHTGSVLWGGVGSS